MLMGMMTAVSACGSQAAQTTSGTQAAQTTQPAAGSQTAQTTQSAAGPQAAQPAGSAVQAAQAAVTEAKEASDDTGGERGTYPDGSSPEYSGEKVCLTIDGQEVVIAMYDNTAAEAFLERLPMENLEFYDLSGIEKPVKNPEVPFSLGEEEPGFDPVTGEMVIYRPWGNFTIFYGDFRHSDELVPLGKVTSGLEILAGQTDDFTGTMELMEAE